MNKFPCRCNKCRGRKTLAKHPDNYLREHHTRCWCGGTYRVDRFRMVAEHKNPCNCTGLWFPHRKGCLWCIHGREPTEEEYRDQCAL